MISIVFIILSLAGEVHPPLPCQDTVLVIPSDLSLTSDVPTQLLYDYAKKNNLRARETIQCTDLLEFAPFLCEDQLVSGWCCNACKKVYMNCCKDEKYTIGLLNQTYEPMWTYDPTKDANNRWNGLLPDFLSNLSNILGYEYTLSPIDIIDLVTGNPLITKDIDFSVIGVSHHMFNSYGDTLPYSRPIFLVNHVIIIRKYETGGGYWRIFAPFTTSLWLLILAAMLTSALIFWLVESRYSVSTIQRTPAGALGAAYFAITTLLVGGEGYEVVTYLGRILRMGTLFFVLIINSTYTAELASILTHESRVVDGPTTLNAAKSRRICCLNGKTELPCVSDLWVEPPFNTLTTRAARDFCENALRSGAVDGIMANEFVGNVIASENCDEFMLSGVEYSPTELSFVGGPDVSGVITNINGGIAELRSQITESTIKEYFPTPCVPDTISSASNPIVTAKHMSGLFIIFACFSSLVIFLFIARFVLESLRYWPCGGKDDTGKDSAGPSLPAVVSKDEVQLIFTNQKKMMNSLKELREKGS
eukprot:TRINITY_DN33616_c0_g1_i1.p1 TRINITY_DN33616_c0_g1~~TRINITY_DN33616_c0_g1_i1.p1  ORF type:complete len:551 (+),score=51.10 TRINITY_DN33616_c0_g1_i1:56-1654(+)